MTDAEIDILALNTVRSGEAAQQPQELAALLKIVNALQPQRMLEIGSYRGGVLKCFRLLCPNAIIYSIDNICLDAKTSTLKDRCKEYNVHLIEADSNDIKTFLTLKEKLNGNKLGFILIDADHKYEVVKRDFELYNALMEEGVIALHDILHHPEHGVERFWKELKAGFKFNFNQSLEEIICTEVPNDIWGGIGIVRMGG